MAMGKVPGSGDEGEDGDGVFAEINITPLTDIFLVLLIIFMVTSSVIVNQGQGAQAGLKVNLPKGGAVSDVTPARTDLAIAILADGRTVIGGEVIGSDELKAKLAAARAANPDTLVIVQADEGVTHGRVVEVMELSKGAGLSQLAIGVRQQAPAK